MRTVLFSIREYFFWTLERITWQMAAGWAAIGVLSFLSCLFFCRKGWVSRAAGIETALFVCLMTAVYSLTVFVRHPSSSHRYKRELFWSYREILKGSTGLIGENFWNVIMFIPIGILLMLLLKRARAVLAAGLLLSMSIELVQLLAKRGLFEFDDIFHNVLGTILAIGIVRIFERCLACRRDAL